MADTVKNTFDGNVHAVALPEACTGGTKLLPGVASGISRPAVSGTPMSSAALQ
jgi:hypothetical protein